MSDDAPSLGLLHGEIIRKIFGASLSPTRLAKKKERTMKYQVWYMKPSFLRGIVGNSPDPNDLSAGRKCALGGDQVIKLGLTYQVGSQQDTRH
jgi:hypothetical protein